MIFELDLEGYWECHRDEKVPTKFGKQEIGHWPGNIKTAEQDNGGPREQG